jgi:peptidoglycan/LPS O-acetylase OafA/YrhL
VPMPPQRELLPALTPLRFPAALIVFVVHAWMMFKGADPLTFTLPHFHLAAAVQFFFLLSGFILTYNYLNEFRAPTKRGVWNFYVARLARVYPVHLLALLVAVPYTVAMFVRPGVAPGSWQYVLAHLTLTNGFVPEASPGVLMFNASAWSLSTEVFLYLMFPLLVPLIAHGSFGRRAFWTVVFLAPWATVVTGLSSGYEMPWWLSPYRFPPVRMADFVFGVLLGAAWRNRTAADGPSRFGTARELFAVGTLCVWAWVMIRLTEGSKYLWLMSWSGVYLVPFVLCLRAFARGEGLLSRVLTTKVPTYLGEISFALYMLHAPVFGILVRWGHRIGFPSWEWPVQWAFAAAITFTLAALCYHLYEIPLRDRLRKALSIKKPKPPEAPPVVVEEPPPEVRKAA